LKKKSGRESQVACRQDELIGGKVTLTLVRVFNTRLLARIQFASRRSCDRPIPSGFSPVLGPRANAALALKFHVALLASHAAFCHVNINISL
jgi:hypothetical protein